MYTITISAVLVISVILAPSAKETRNENAAAIGASFTQQENTNEESIYSPSEITKSNVWNISVGQITKDSTLEFPNQYENLEDIKYVVPSFDGTANQPNSTLSVNPNGTSNFGIVVESYAEKVFNNTSPILPFTNNVSMKNFAVSGVETLKNNTSFSAVELLVNNIINNSNVSQNTSSVQNNVLRNNLATSTTVTELPSNSSQNDIDNISSAVGEPTMFADDLVQTPNNFNNVSNRTTLQSKSFNTSNVLRTDILDQNNNISEISQNFSDVSTFENGKTLNDSIELTDTSNTSDNLKSSSVEKNSEATDHSDDVLALVQLQNLESLKNDEQYINVFLPESSFGECCKEFEGVVENLETDIGNFDYDEYEYLYNDENEERAKNEVDDEYEEIDDIWIVIEFID